MGLIRVRAKLCRNGPNLRIPDLESPKLCCAELYLYPQPGKIPPKTEERGMTEDENEESNAAFLPAQFKSSLPGTTVCIIHTDMSSFHRKLVIFTQL